MSLKYGSAPAVDADLVQSHDLVVWSIGRHPIDGNYSRRLGVNDAEEHYRSMFLGHCALMNATETCKRVVWLDTHAGIKPRHADEDYLNELAFHIEIPFWIYRACKIQRIASAWDASSRLVSNHLADAHAMSFDGAHWGYAINLLKAVAIMKRGLMTLFDVSPQRMNHEADLQRNLVLRSF